MEKLFIDTVTSVTDDTCHNQTVDVPISRAAQVLGISERTVWRKIDKGELKSRTKGNKRLVRIPVFSPTTQTTPDGHVTLHDTPSKANAVVDLTVLLRELQAANYRIGFLESQNRTYEEQVKLLPDFQAQAAKAQLHEVTVQELNAELSQLKSTWWYRFCRWFLGQP